MDSLTKKQRSYNMSMIKSKDTKPEIIVRKFLHKIGYRFRIHKKSLPGKPDIYIKKLNLVIFVHGCFWHDHGCTLSNSPKTNSEYWKNKFKINKNRDKLNINNLKNLGYNVAIIWECNIRNNSHRIETFLQGILKDFQFLK